MGKKSKISKKENKKEKISRQQEADLKEKGAGGIPDVAWKKVIGCGG